MRRGSWSVVSTVRAPDALVARFVEHHLALGAERIHLFFDDPAQVWVPASRDAAGVEIAVCSAAWWARAAGRPDLFELRQLHNAECARAACRTEWLLHIDVDEFVDGGTRVSESLAGFGADVFSLVLPPVEAVYDGEPLDAADALATPWFRRARADLPRAVLERLYGPSADLPRSGLFGHLGGKSFVRVAMEPGVTAIHRPEPADSRLRSAVPMPGFELRHFHALDFADWLEKWQRRIDRSVLIRGQQAARLSDAFRRARDEGGGDSLRRLYRDWYVLGKHGIEIARAAGSVVGRNPLGIAVEA